MRKNLPVTNVEHVLEDNAALVSTTDLKSRITYANPSFINISGFTEEELIGAPHNIVRHPDMPPEAFADLWQTVQSGQSWTALVKNRCKNGDYYWVKANVTPVIDTVILSATCRCASNRVVKKSLQRAHSTGKYKKVKAVRHS